MRTQHGGGAEFQIGEAPLAKAVHEPPAPMSLKDWASTIQSVTVVASLIVGGIWSYSLFIKERKHYPHANMQMAASHVELPAGDRVLRVHVDITNSGSSRLLLRRSTVRLQQVLPLAPCAEPPAPCAQQELARALDNPDRVGDRFSWVLLAERARDFDPMHEIEPLEKDELDAEFAVPAAVEVVRIYSYLRNEQKTTSASELGWATSTYYDFRKPKEREQ